MGHSSGEKSCSGALLSSLYCQSPAHFSLKPLSRLEFHRSRDGVQAFRDEIIRSMVIDSRRFGFEIEVTAKVAKFGCRVQEVPTPFTVVLTDKKFALPMLWQHYTTSLSTIFLYLAKSLHSGGKSLDLRMEHAAWFR